MRGFDIRKVIKEAVLSGNQKLVDILLTKLKCQEYEQIEVMENQIIKIEAQIGALNELMI